MPAGSSPLPARHKLVRVPRHNFSTPRLAPPLEIRPSVEIRTTQEEAALRADQLAVLLLERGGASGTGAHRQGGLRRPVRRRIGGTRWVALGHRFGSRPQLSARLEGLIVTLAGAGAAQRLSFTHHFAAEVDPLATLGADRALALVAGKFLRGQLDPYRLDVEQVVVGHLAVSQHLLLVLVR